MKLSYVILQIWVLKLQIKNSDLEFVNIMGIRTNKETEKKTAVCFFKCWVQGGVLIKHISTEPPAAC